MTEKELEAEREAQTARGEMPRYGGQHAHLTEEQRQQLEVEGRQSSIRLQASQNQTYSFDDMIEGGISFSSNGIGSWVIAEEDGILTYNFAAATDDHYMGVSDVTHGDGHISSTSKQIMTYETSGWKPSRFGHMSLIVNEERKELSKHGGQILQFIEQYRDLGYLPEALFNFIALLGWPPEGKEEVFPKEEFIRIFDEKYLSRSPALFGKQGLAWVDSQCIKQKDTETIFQLALPHLTKANLTPGVPSEEDLSWERKLIALYQEEMSYAGEIVPLSETFFKEMPASGEEEWQVISGEQVPELMTHLFSRLEALEPFEAAEVKKAIKEVQKEAGIRGKQLFTSIRAAVISQVHDPELPNVVGVPGKEKALNRLKQYK